MVIVYVQMWRAAKQIQRGDHAAYKWNYPKSPCLNHNRDSSKSAYVCEIDSLMGGANLAPKPTIVIQNTKLTEKNGWWKNRKSKINDEENNNNQTNLPNKNKNFLNKNNSNNSNINNNSTHSYVLNINDNNNNDCENINDLSLLNGVSILSLHI